MEEWDWGIFIAVTGALTSFATVLVLYLKSRGENKVAAANVRAAQDNSKTALDKRIDDRVAAQLEGAWKKIDELSASAEKLEQEVLEVRTNESRRIGAITRILKDIASQWPADVEGPKLNPADIALIEETIPTSWITRTAKSKSA